MSNKLYAVKRSDAGVSILCLIGKEQDGKVKYPDIEKDIIAKWPDDKRDSVISWREIDENQIPKDRTFRDAWTDAQPTDTVDIDMKKARAIHMNKIREKRNEKLAELDIETMKGNDVQTEKQKLRDIPQSFDLSGASTPKDLKALWPDELEDG